MVGYCLAPHMGPAGLAVKPLDLARGENGIDSL